MENLVYLVTGAAGHLGGAVCRQLVENNCKVRALVLPGDKAAKNLPNEVEIMEGDICDMESLERFFSVGENVETYVLHIASIVTVTPEYNQKVMDVNVGGTKNIIDCCLKFPSCRKLVYCGSTGAIPEDKTGSKIKEVDHFDEKLVHGCYSQSKALASQAVLDAVRDRGLKACIVQPSGILGPGDLGVSVTTRTLIDIVEGNYPMGLDGTFNLCDVRDLADGTIAAAEKGRIGESYILANEVVSFREFSKMVADEAGCKPIRSFVPLKLAYVIASVVEKFADKNGPMASLSTFTINSLARNNTFDWSKAERDLGYKTRPFVETVRDEISWLKNAGVI